VRGVGHQQGAAGVVLSRTREAAPHAEAGVQRALSAEVERGVAGALLG
jgi:hypothetical protein